MSKHSELLYGDHEQVNFYLDQTACTEVELRAALLNAFRRIQQLESVVISLKRQQQGA